MACRGSFFQVIFYQLNAIALLLGAQWLAPAAQAANDCLKIRAAFDIGSGATKMVVAKVNTCQQQVAQILVEQQLGVNYYQDLQQNGQKLSPKIEQEGLQVLQNLMAVAKQQGAQEFVAVGTKVFRDAQNAEDYAKKIAAAGITFKILKDDEEAIIGFRAAAAKTGINPKDLVMWDIGGGSMQIAIGGNPQAPLDPQDMYLGNIAAKSFLHLVLTTFYKAGTKTPNPYGKKTTQVQKMAQGLAEAFIPPALRSKIAGKQVVGIGPVHNIAVLKVLAPSTDYQIDQLEKSIKAKANYTDAQLGNDQFAPETLTNALLVAGFMQALQIKKLTAVNIHLGHGLLLQNP